MSAYNLHPLISRCLKLVDRMGAVFRSETEVEEGA